jgi:hypothetical protein
MIFDEIMTKKTCVVSKSIINLVVYYFFKIHIDFRVLTSNIINWCQISQLDSTVSQNTIEINYSLMIGAL